MKKIVILFFVILAASSVAVLAYAPSIYLRVAEKLPVVLSVLLAAVFVRLARGMPTIPYEKVEESQARLATRAFRSLIKSYVVTFAVFILAISSNIVASLLQPDELARTPQYLIPGVLASLNFLVVVSIIFLVKSDVDLATIQADMMDEVTSSASDKSIQASVENVKSAFVTDKRESPKIERL